MKALVRQTIEQYAYSNESDVYRRGELRIFLIIHVLYYLLFSFIASASIQVTALVVILLAFTYCKSFCFFIFGCALLLQVSFDVCHSIFQ